LYVAHFLDYAEAASEHAEIELEAQSDEEVDESMPLFPTEQLYSGPAGANDGNGTSKANAIRELKSYLDGTLTRDFCRAELTRTRTSKVVLKVDALEFWDRAQLSFPVLAQFARNYLAIPATSISCEQLFSQVGQITTPLRSRLLTETVRHEACVRYWSTYFSTDENQ
jgi:hAT family C-terminal dimerisation region